MKIYDIHSHFGPTSSGEIVSANNMISELKILWYFKSWN